jgi:hypothetical protein
MEKKPTTKRYPPELKERAVRMVLDLREQDPHDKDGDLEGGPPAGSATSRCGPG